MKTSAYKVRNSNKSKRIKREEQMFLKLVLQLLKIKLQNQVIYYVQVIDSKNNVLGDKIIDFGADTLTYSFMTTVKYENKTVQVTENLPGKDFEKEPIVINF
jgi:Zn-dependent M32 family carboxypeptidase